MFRTTAPWSVGIWTTSDPILTLTTSPALENVGRPSLQLTSVRDVSTSALMAGTTAPTPTTARRMLASAWPPAFVLALRRPLIDSGPTAIGPTRPALSSTHGLSAAFATSGSTVEPSRFTRSTEAVHENAPLAGGGGGGGTPPAAAGDAMTPSSSAAGAMHDETDLHRMRTRLWYPVADLGDGKAQPTAVRPIAHASGFRSSLDRQSVDVLVGPCLLRGGNIAAINRDVSPTTEVGPKFRPSR